MPTVLAQVKETDPRILDGSHMRIFAADLHLGDVNVYCETCKNHHDDGWRSMDCYIQAGVIEL